jgi:Ca-activated chloride channel homolog
MQKVLSFLAIICILSTDVSLAASDDNPFLKGGVASLSGGIQDDNSKGIIIVLDVSGSMSEPSQEAGTKILMAKQVLERVLAKIDSSIPVGLRVYGSSKPSMDPVIACQDSTLLVPVGIGNRGQMISKLRELKPSGSTPISYALRRAVEDLKYVNVKNKNIVLISDGMETCGGDPCAVARSLKGSGVDLQFNVVGFNVDADYAAKAQLQCIAKSTGGEYFGAETAAQLSEGILEGINHKAPSINTVTGQLQEIGGRGKTITTSPLSTKPERNRNSNKK